MLGLPAGLIAIIAFLCILAWFLIGEKKSIFEKLSTLFIFLVIVVMYRLSSGDTIENMLSLVRDFIKGR